MNRTCKNAVTKSLGQLALIVVAASFILGPAATAWAQGDMVVVSKKVKVNAKGDIVIGPKPVTVAKGTATTTFNFHPVDVVSTNYNKTIVPNPAINPNP